MNKTEILRQAVLYAINELDGIADFIGGLGYFTAAKSIKIDVIYRLQHALDECSNNKRSKE